MSVPLPLGFPMAEDDPPREGEAGIVLPIEAIAVASTDVGTGAP